MILFILVCFTNTQASLQFTLTPEVGLIDGYTEYEMDYYFKFLNYITGEPVPTVWRINSLLEFPLDASIGGISGKLQSDYDPNRWSVYLKYLTTFTDPSDKMQDSDGEGFSTLFPYTQISYTESDAKMNLDIFEAGFQYRFMNKKQFDVSFTFEFRYQQIYQELIGYDGWYRPFDTAQLEYFDSTIAISGAADTVGISYKLQMEQIAFGFQSNIFITDKFTIQIKSAFAPIVYNDTDDHKLRFKRSTSNGFGMGFKGGFNIRYELPYLHLSFIQLSSSLNTYSAKNTQAQIWYEHETGIDPETQRSIILVPEGTAIGNIPHDIRGKSYTINIELGIQF